MRKLFSILAVALFALSAHATVVTHNFDLSQFSNYGTATVSGGTITDAAAWNGAQSWEWTEGASNYDQVVLEVATHTQPILFKVLYTDEYSVQKEMSADVNSAVIDLDPTQNTIKGVQILNWSENSDIDITITGLYMRGAIGNKKNVTLWTGSSTFEDFSWENRLQISDDNFADLHVGDILEVYYTTDEHDFHQYDLKLEQNNEYPTFFGEQVNLSGSNENGVMRFYIADNSDLTEIDVQNGIYLNGKYITFTKVSVIKHEVLWTGSQAIGEWTNDFDIPASKLSDLQVGNILCIRVSAIGTEASPRVALAYGDSWNDFDPKVVYNFQEGDEAPMVVEFPVTYKMKQQLDGNKLVIRGVNYTVTDIYVKDGTPTNTVAGYLNVTSAGMATLVLPFDVPSLPEGVQAYNLTNNGDATIWAEEVTSLTADKPVLIIAAAGEHEFVSVAGASDDISSKTATYTNGALIGTYTTIDPLAQQTGGAYNYILQDGAEGVGFYQVRDNPCSVAPYRAYLSCGYNNANAGSADHAPRMRIVFRENTTTGVENTESAKPDGARKLLRNGQLFILRNGVEYNANGALVK